jgi:hypothetical protein
MLIPLNLVGGLIWTKNYFKVGKKPERQLWDSNDYANLTT